MPGPTPLATPNDSSIAVSISTQRRNKVPIGYNGTPQIHTPNCPFPFDDHHQNLIHPYRYRPHSPPQTASGSNQPFCHKARNKVPICYNGTRQIHPPKLPLPLGRSPPKSNTSIPSPIPLTTPTASGSNQPFCHKAYVRTDGDDECSITILLRSAILIASDALKILHRPTRCKHNTRYYDVS